MFASFDEPDDLSDPVLDFDEDDELDELASLC